MSPGRGKTVAAVTMVLAVLVLLGFAASHYLLREEPSGREPWRRKFPAAEVPELMMPARGSPTGGQKVYISEGNIPVAAFIEFLSDCTGIATIPEGDVDLQAWIRLPAPIEDADAEVVRKIFEANRLLILRDKLPGGREVLRIVNHPSRPENVEAAKPSSADPSKGRGQFRPRGTP